MAGADSPAFANAGGSVLCCGSRMLDLGRPQIMGILNITPDSFSDGGLLHSGGRPLVDKALRLGRQMLAEGAGILDVGGESTRPGALPPGDDEELDRVMPVVEALVAETDSIISVDTSNPALMRAAAAAGAHIINDVRALRRPGAVEAVAASGLAVCLVHLQGEPQRMQECPEYGDVVAEVRGFLQERRRICNEAGINDERIVLDPGFGFGKSLEHNLDLLRGLDTLAQCGRPVLAGLSRKSMVGAICGRPCAQHRMPGSLALGMVALARGARILRVHDLGPTMDMLRAWERCMEVA